MRILKYNLSKRLREELNLRTELSKSGLSRRDLLKLGAVTGGAALLLSMVRWPGVSIGDDDITSPPTDPWAEELPVPKVLEPVAPYSAHYNPPPNPYAHQYYTKFPPKKYYFMKVQERRHSFHPRLSDSTIWGFNGTFPGPTIHARYGEPVMLRIMNDLPSLADHRGFGLPEIITHLHNAHTASESDGGPWNWTKRGEFTDHHYLQARAGFSVPDTIPAEFRDSSGGDIRESLNTLFFHYHRPDVTAEGVYKGLLGFYFNFDECDTGDEEDMSPAWCLPSGPYDIPLVFADKRFDPRTGELFFDQTDLDGILGDKMSVNGKIQPYCYVKRRKYRFRLLDGGPARFYRVMFRHEGRSYPFTQVTHSGNFLERPRHGLLSLELQVAERSDIVIDFSQFRPGSRVYLANVLPMKDGRQPDRDKALNPDDVNNQLVEFRIEGEASDPSRIPDVFRPFPPVVLSEVVQRRLWRFERGNGLWQINAEEFDAGKDHRAENLDNPRHQVRRNTAEIWTLENRSGGWEHPVHIHFEEAQVIRVNGKDQLADPKTRQRTDMYRLGRNSKIELFMRFRDFPDPDFVRGRLGDRSRYVMHCHNTTHEDHAMMATWNVVPPS
jgi:FtsP/CotA-like multicopper oxidase with cupredoxin domain